MTEIRVHNNCLFIDDDSGRVILQHNARPGLRPYIHPLRGPDGQTCLTEDSPWHHPWQHGVQTGFHGVNGCDFWFDPGQRRGDTIGTIEPSEPRVLDSAPPKWAIDARWRHEDGSELLKERQTWTLTPADDLLYLDLNWQIEAIPAVLIQQGAYGGLFIRMPYREQSGATVINAAGQVGDDTEQQAAAWVDLFMPVNDGKASGGITVLDHPGNPGHPAQWRVDGQRGINPAPCIPGPIELPAGETMRYRYRLILRHSDPLAPEVIQSHWKRFSAETESSTSKGVQ
jgi:hypothetical protein